MNDMSAAELAAYINGILENLPDGDSPETKALRAVAAAITRLVDEVAVLAGETERMRQYLDELDSDLGELEADYYGDYDDFDYEDWPSGVSQHQPIIFRENESESEIKLSDKSDTDGGDKGRE